MPYRVVKQVVPKPADWPDQFAWDDSAYAAALDNSEAVHEFSSQSEAQTKADELESADGTGRKYKVIEV